MRLSFKNINIHQKSCRQLYHTWRIESVQLKKYFVCVIHDKMDHSEIAFLQFQIKYKWCPSWVVPSNINWNDYSCPLG